VSKEKKARKARTPNVPRYTGPTQSGSGGGGSLTVESSAPSATTTSGTAAARATRTEAITADYTHVVSDLKRIAVLAGGLIVVLVILTFIIK
jgi:hypothetical protein